MRVKTIIAITVTCMTCFTSTIPAVSAFASEPVVEASTYEKNDPQSIKNNIYYKEVSGMVSEIVSSVTPESNREYLYHNLMATVFGEAYTGSPDSSYVAKAIKDDGGMYLGLMTVQEYESMPKNVRSFATNFSAKIARSSGKVYAYTDLPSSVNENGIDPERYEDIKTLYQVYKNGLTVLAPETSQMDKAKALTKYVCSVLTPAADTVTDHDTHAYLPRSIRKGTGLCAAYSDLYWLIGQASGLDVSLDYHVNAYQNHVLNVITIDGVKYYTDVIYYDSTSNSAYCMNPNCPHEHHGE